MNGLKKNLRPCVVDTPKGDKRAYFHKWADHSNVLRPSYLEGGHNGGEVRYTVAIVEYEDGRVEEVMPSQIRFDVPQYGSEEMQLKKLGCKCFISTLFCPDLEAEKARADAEAKKRIFEELEANFRDCLKRTESEDPLGAIEIEYELYIARCKE